MALTFEDIKNKLKQMDEVSLLEILQIYSEDIVDRFEDKIEYLYYDLVAEFPDEVGD